MHMGPKKYGHCPNVWVEDTCKVLGRGFKKLGVCHWGHRRGDGQWRHRHRLTKGPIYLVVYYVL